MNTELTLILNTHMPYVLGQSELFDEPENWLFEAITESYIPLFQMLSRWQQDSFVGKKIILSMTPCMVDQLLNCRDRYLAYLDVMGKIAWFEVERTQNIELYNAYQKNPAPMSQEQLALLHQSALSYLHRINSAVDFMSNHELIAFVRNLLDNKLSHVELWTSSPNHNFLPFFEQQTRAHFARRGVELFERVFDRSPDGFWLPECAYTAGVEQALLQAGIRQTALSLNAIEPYHPEIKSGIYRYRDLKLLVHDFRLAMNIWQAPADTLPSNPVYREFYRDLGMDVTPEYFKHLGIRLPNRQQRKSGVWTGFKYHAGSGAEVPLGEKSLYDVAAAQAQTKQDVVTFLQILNRQREQVFDQKNFILAFDTELFGHWWHEGVLWLENLLQHDFNSEV